MKLLFMLLWFFSLSACTFYTVTNSSSTDLRIETPNEITSLKAGECIELTEYFLGLAGDFPFVILGEKTERNTGHYEITDLESTETKTEPNSQPYTVSLSKKNTECNKEDKKKSEDNDDDNTKTNSQATNWIEDTNKNVFCFNGLPTCSQGKPKCIQTNKTASASTPACVQGLKKTQSQPVCSSPTSGSSANQKAMCLSPVSVVVVNQSPLCGGGTATCSEGGRVVCGKTQGSTQNQAYCVNMKNIRWAGSVTCSNGTSPSCPDTSP